MLRPSEPKVRKPEARSNEVFPPSTTNGGVVSAPVFVPEPVAAPAQHVQPVAPSAPAEDFEAIPVITPLEGETIQAVAATQSAGSEGGMRPAAPMQRTQHPPFPPRNDRGRGGFGGNRGGRGGRNQRFGRPGQGQGGRGGRDRRPAGRDLPPSKYASPAGTESRPHDSKPYVPPAATDFEPIILPGESLSIFKDRAQSALSAPAARVSQHSTFSNNEALSSNEAAGVPPSTRTYTDEELSAGLPGSLFATPSTVAPGEHEAPIADVKIETSAGVPKYSAASSPEPEMEIPRNVYAPLSDAGYAETVEAQTTNGAALSEEETTSLAEQLTEAKHEEAQAEAEARPEAVEAVAESYVEPAELEELQEALDTDTETDQESDQETDHETDHEDDHEDEHMDAAAEADAIADRNA